jgi:nucleoid-associated protein YgaU
MKRDARIGLAVVLVLGLAITLLIGRALYNDNDHLASTEGENAATEAAVPYSGEVRRVDGAETNNLATAAAASPVTMGSGAADTATRAPQGLTPAVQQFIQDQNTHAPATAQPVLGPAPIPTPTPPTTSMMDKSKLVTPVPKTATGDDPLNADHELTTPPKGDNDATPGEGYAYTVAAGDNIWKISNKVYGDGKYTQKILAANAGLNADKMKVGSVIRIPVIAHKTLLVKLPSFADAGKKVAPASVPAGRDAGPTVATAKKTSAKSGPETAVKTVKAEAGPTEATTHKVESGETLGAIAKKYYGVSGPKTIARILAVNKGLDPAKLKVGQEIALPASTK